MKYAAVLFLALSSVSFADAVSPQQELARYAVDCDASSSSGINGTNAFNGKMQGTVSAFQKVSESKLQLGVVDAFNFSANFNFNIADRSVGRVTFSLQNADGVELSKSALPLPKLGLDEASLYYVDTANAVSVEIHCSISPQAI